ncbi:MAG: DUF6338 family protein [Fimbriimonas sp.]
MDLLGNLTPENLRAFADYFLMGYAYRTVERSIRGASKEDEIHTVVLAVVWSVVLSALLPIVQVDFPDWIPQKARPALGLASHVAFGACIGILVAVLRPTVQDLINKIRDQASEHPKLKRSLNPDLASRSHDQALARFCAHAGDRQVEFHLKNGSTIAGCIKHFEAAADEVASPKLIIHHAYRWETDHWDGLDGFEWIMLKYEDVEQMRLLVAPCPNQPLPASIPTQAATHEEAPPTEVRA